MYYFWYLNCRRGLGQQQSTRSVRGFTLITALCDGLHYCLGCNGSGLAMTYLGWQMARKIARVANCVCSYDTEDFPHHPLYSGKSWFLPAVGGYYRLRDNLDRLLA
jgi:hypothetical protein